MLWGKRLFEGLQDKILSRHSFDHENISQARCLLIMLLVGIPLTGIATLLIFVFAPGFLVPAIGVGFFLAVQTVTLLVLRNGAFRLAGLLFSGGLWGFSILMFAFWNEVTSPGFPILLIGLFTTQLILGETAVVTNAAASIVLTSVLTFNQYALHGNLDGSSAGFQMLMQSSLIAVAAGLSILIGRSKHWDMITDTGNQKNPDNVGKSIIEIDGHRHNGRTPRGGQHNAGSGRYEFEVPEGEVIWSEETFRILRRDPRLGELALDEYLRIVHPEDRSTINQSIERAVTQRKSFVCTYRVMTADDETFYIRSQGKPELDAKGNVVRIVGTIQDVTEYYDMDKDLVENETRYQGLFENSPISLWEVDYSQIREYLDRLVAGDVDELHTYLIDQPEEVFHCFSLLKILVVNQATVELLEAENKEQIYNEFTAGPTDTMLSMFHQQLVSLMNTGKNFQGEATFRTFMGNEKHVTIRVSIAPGHEENWDKVFISLLDISGRKKLEAQLQGFLAEMVRQSRTDSLTGLFNRRAMLEYAGAELNRIQRKGGYYSVMLLDLDYLKDVNDQYGHQAGNEALLLLAQTLQEEKRAYDWAGRWGGDEFILVLPDIEPHKASQIAQRLLMRFREKELLVSSGERVQLTTSIGISGKIIRSDEIIDLNVLLREADQALYQAKQTGRNQIYRYDELPK